MIKNFKYALLLALFCSAQIPAQAGWFYNICKNKWVEKTRRIYPFNMLIAAKASWNARQEYQNNRINNEDAQKNYPHAFAYVQEQLKAAGIDPLAIEIANTPNFAESSCKWQKLTLPLAAIENQTHESQRAANQAKVLSAHEFGHLQDHYLAKRALASLAIIAGIECGFRAIPFTNSKFLETLLKTLCSQGLLTAYDHYSEHLADSYAIKTFKKNPTALLDTAIFFLDMHQASSKNNIFSSKTSDSKKVSLDLRYNPIKNNLLHWIIDVHGSYISRANRLIQAAGLPCNQWLLARMLKHQVLEHLSQINKECPKDMCPHAFAALPKNKIDTECIIEALKKLDAVEIPYPFETYGQ